MKLPRSTVKPKKVFASFLPRLISIERNIPLSSIKQNTPAARIPSTTIAGYRVTRTDKANDKGVEAIVIWSSSPPFAKELKKQILRTRTLESRRRKFTVVVPSSEEVPQWYCHSDIARGGPDPLGYRRIRVGPESRSRRRNSTTKWVLMRLFRPLTHLVSMLSTLSGGSRRRKSKERDKELGYT